MTGFQYRKFQVTGFAVWSAHYQEGTRPVADEQPPGSCLQNRARSTGFPANCKRALLLSWPCATCYLFALSGKCGAPLVTVSLKAPCRLLRSWCTATQGLFFYHTRKVGLGIGVKWGAGVLFTHLTDEHGRTGWSAPALYRVKEAALGLIAGARSAVAGPAQYSREPVIRSTVAASAGS